MTVYVDALIWERHDRLWCHLLGDDDVQLHALAAAIGCARHRYQSRPARPWVDHYDIDEQRRRMAIERGAVALTRSEVVALIARKRYASSTASPSATVPGSSTAP